jgi:non-homologous end joining protein Ku
LPNWSAYSGTEPTRVARSEFIEVGEALVAVGRSPIRKDTGEVIDSADVIRKAKATNGAWVTLTDDEVAEATSLVRGVGTIEAFIPVKHLDRYLAEGQMQVRPKTEKGKPNPAATKAYALLLKAMRSRKVVALVKVALRGPARYGLLNSEGVFTLVYTADAIREHRPMEAVEVSKAELEMAASLIDAVGVDTPLLLDTNAPAVQAYVDTKATGKAPEVITTPSPTVDIMAAISASIDAAKAARAS